MPLGCLVGDGFKPDGLLDQIGARWEITRNWLRLRACCNPIYAALDALDEAIAALNAKAEDIKSIDIATFRFATVMCNPDPPNYFASKYSLPHVAACLAVRGSAGYESVNDSALDDPAIKALRHRVHIIEDPAMTSAVPVLKPARVTLTLNDGRQATRSCDSPRGDYLNPYDESEIRLKFRQLAGMALTPKGVDELERAVEGFEHWTSGAELTGLLRRHCLPDWGSLSSRGS